MRAIKKRESLLVQQSSGSQSVVQIFPIQGFINFFKTTQSKYGLKTELFIKIQKE